MRRLRPDAFEPGAIVDQGGNVLGRHEGIGGFTVGQRRGLGLAASAPLYVLELDPARRRVTVGPRSSLGVSEAAVDDIAWTAIPEPHRPLRVDAVLRYRAQPVPAVIHPVRAGAARVVFIEPAWPVTPGQAAVFYDGDTVLGGGRLLKTA